MAAFEYGSHRSENLSHRNDRFFMLAAIIIFTNPTQDNSVEPCLNNNIRK